MPTVEELVVHTEHLYWHLKPTMVTLTVEQRLCNAFKRSPWCIHMEKRHRRFSDVQKTLVAAVEGCYAQIVVDSALIRHARTFSVTIASKIHGIFVSGMPV